MLLWRSNPQWQVTFVNDKAARLLQADHLQLNSQVFWEVFPEELGAQHLSLYKQALQEQSGKTFEVFL